MPVRALEIARRHRRATATIVYSAITGFALALAYLARWEFDPSVLAEWEFAGALVVLVSIRLAVNYGFRLGMSRWRFVGIPDFLRLLAAVTVGSLAFWLVSWTVPLIPAVPRSIILLEWVFSGYMTGGTWVLYRLAYEGFRRNRKENAQRVLVVGAGEAGQQLVHQMRRAGAGYLPVAFIDDDPLKWGTLVHGVEVVGAIDDASAIATAYKADEIIVAVPSATPAEIRAIVGHCEEADLPLKILPGIEDVIAGNVDLGLIRDIQVEDLLGRDPIRLELPELAAAMGGKTVLVTGAAGSIGSELARQIARHGPRRLVLLDQAETPLYYLELELRKLAPELALVCVVGDVTNPDSLDRVFAEHGPDRVFHAAAYKHVPMMEHNPGEAVRTNVVGTFNVARAAGRCGAGTFTLISTDKAVQPANVMGATKNLAEKVVLQVQSDFPETSFGAVRFGNVLGSNGSVIPIFRRQLKAGEPLTVTHEDVTRFFMTIPEAVQLVLQASLVPGIHGRVAMLDMGEPIRIMDLARDLLRLSGKPFRLGATVEVTGLRPGEKLHEELAAPDEGVEETEVDRVFLVEPRPSEAIASPPVWKAVSSGDIPFLLDWLYQVFPELDRRERERGLDAAETATRA